FSAIGKKVILKEDIIDPIGKKVILKEDINDSYD
ncbi:unnamed protein product, partial [marine sediment metagenome]